MWIEGEAAPLIREFKPLVAFQARLPEKARLNKKRGLGFLKRGISG
jgi:hypothetical protein